MRDTLENRMKLYESLFSYKIDRNFIVVRVDGKNFSKFTKKLRESSLFDYNIINSMNYAANQTAYQIQNCVGYYVQSDECSFLLKALQNENSEHWFGGKLNKINSVIASYFTYYFNKNLQKNENILDQLTDKFAVFDCRTFGIPDDKPEEAINYFVWRIKDAYKNSLNRFAYFYKPKLLFLSKNKVPPQKQIIDYLQNHLSIPFEFLYNKIYLKVKDCVLFNSRNIDIHKPIFPQLKDFFEYYEVIKLEGERNDY